MEKLTCDATSLNCEELAVEQQVFDVRRLDKLGRLRLPEALRALLGWQNGDVIALSVTTDGRVFLERRTGECEQAAPEDRAAP